jgi:RNase P subunit RPR2
MATSRPLECPACGHERITRRPIRRRVESVGMRADYTDWSCELCAYAWKFPMGSRHGAGLI